MDKLIRELHKVFNIINETKYNNELIEPIITVQSNTNKKKMILGWCSCLPRWIHKLNDKERHFYEINICADQLNRPYEQIIETLLHEVVHLYNGQRNINDCNPRSQKHLEPFKNEAERIGLIVENTGRCGWSQTSLSEKLLKEIQEMDIDRTAFDIYMIDEHREPKTVNRKPTFKYRCPICNKEIKSVEEELRCICRECETEYEKVFK